MPLYLPGIHGNSYGVVLPTVSCLCLSWIHARQSDYHSAAILEELDVQRDSSASSCPHDTPALRASQFPRAPSPVASRASFPFLSIQVLHVRALSAPVRPPVLLLLAASPIQAARSLQVTRPQPPLAADQDHRPRPPLNRASSVQRHRPTPRARRHAILHTPPPPPPPARDDSVPGSVIKGCMQAPPRIVHPSTSMRANLPPRASPVRHTSTTLPSGTCYTRKRRPQRLQLQLGLRIR